MPYPNEHSARLKNPDDFDPKSFRRTEGGTLYGKIKVPVTIGIIWGKLKGKAKPSDPVAPQALRFPTKNWTVEQAKKWLKDNNVKPISFEPASKEEKQARREAWRSEGIKVCIELIQQVQEMEGVAGVHVMAIEWEEAVEPIVQGAGLLPRPVVA